MLKIEHHEYSSEFRPCMEMADLPDGIHTLLDEGPALAAPAIIPLWGEGRSLPMLRAYHRSRRRVLYVLSRTLPPGVSKLTFQRIGLQRLLDLPPFNRRVPSASLGRLFCWLLDADVFLGQADADLASSVFQLTSQPVSVVLTGFAAGIGSIAADPLDLLSALPPDEYDGWGFEDMAHFYALAARGVRPTTITTQDSLYVYHTHALRNAGSADSVLASATVNHKRFLQFKASLSPFLTSPEGLFTEALLTSHFSQKP